MIRPIVVSIRIDSAALGRALDTAADVVAEEVLPAVIEAQLLLQREIVERTPTSGAGTLRNSIGALPVVFAERRILGEVGTALAYALPVETGSKPHRPPIEPLIDWVTRKLGLRGKEARRRAHAIAGKIARDGTKANWMFRDGLGAAQAQVYEIIAAGTARALARVEGGGP